MDYGTAGAGLAEEALKERGVGAAERKRRSYNGVERWRCEALAERSAGGAEC